MKEWESFTNQKQWKAYLQKLLRTNDKALLKALEVIYRYQTEEEKRSALSLDENGVGFSKYDSRELTELANKLKSKRALTEHEMCVLRAKLPKYWKQLMKVSKAKMSTQNEKESQEETRQVEIRDEEIYHQVTIEELMKRAQAEQLRKCSDESISCDYGICSECPLSISEED